jgi:hypothetical protein
VCGVDLLDDVLDEDVEEQGPLAVLADADEPCLECVVLVVATATGARQRRAHID